jgi:hypothetical protein
VLSQRAALGVKHAGFEVLPLPRPVVHRARRVVDTTCYGRGHSTCYGQVTISVVGLLFWIQPKPKRFMHRCVVGE